jgi:hypothetical protein
LGTIKRFTPAKLVMPVLTSDRSKEEELACLLERDFGPRDYTSHLLPFTFTSYYDKEMGTPIYRFFISFQNLADPSLLPEVKVRTNEIENLFSENGRRRINLDPGMLFLSRFVLASTKDGSYRIPLRLGIYGEITLVYAKNAFHDVELTYPDFQSETYKSILTEIRNLYKAQLQKLDPGIQG